jgi:hypothetical protein
MTTTSNKQERVKLITNVQEREHYETLAELYSVIYATEKLEKAFIRDSISQEDYTQQCLLLIQKFKSLRNIINMSVDEFMEKYKLNCPAAKHRLMVMGAPETVKKDKVGKVYVFFLFSPILCGEFSIITNGNCFSTVLEKMLQSVHNTLSHLWTH